jgi:hypothetical protein
MRNGVLIVASLCCLLCSGGCPKPETEPTDINVVVEDSPEVETDLPPVDVDITTETAPGGDVTDPVIAAITGIETGHVITGTVTVSARATDDVGVTSFTMSLDGNEVVASTDDEINYTWNAAQASDGMHTFEFKATDAAGNIGVERIQVATGLAEPDSTKPEITGVSGVRSDLPVSGVAQIAASASDNVGITRFVLTIDGNDVVTANSGSLSYDWDTMSASNGQHTLVFTASDAYGNSAIEQMEVLVANGPDS